MVVLYEYLVTPKLRQQNGFPQIKILTVQQQITQVNIKENIAFGQKVFDWNVDQREKSQTGQLGLMSTFEERMRQVCTQKKTNLSSQFRGVFHVYAVKPDP